MRDFDPQSMVTRHHFYGYQPHPHSMAPPPLHVFSMNPAANWAPVPRPLAGARGAQPGPARVLADYGMPSLGIDPTDPTTWGGRGYRQCNGMVGRLNHPGNWAGNPEQLNPLGMGS